MAGPDTLVVGEPVPSLARWGCSPDADLVYRELIHSGPRPATVLARELGLSVRRVSDAVQNLHELDAVVPFRPDGPTRPAHWRARPQRHVVTNLSQRRLRPAGRPAPIRAQLHLIASLLGPSVDLDTNVRHLPSRLAARRRLAELSVVEQDEHLAMNTERTFDAASVRAGAQMDRAALARGVHHRVLGLQPASDPPPHRGPDEPIHPRWSYREGGTVPLKLFVVDRRVALFPVDPANLECGYLEVVQPPVVRALAALFDRHWAQARDPRENDMPQYTLTARERSLIHLLAQGHTDATAARELQISPRSVSNILRTLMDQFGVENRFQLGLALGALRVAEPPPHRPDLTRPDSSTKEN